MKVRPHGRSLVEGTIMNEYDLQAGKEGHSSNRERYAKKWPCSN
jgi:hypothetical protein